MICKLGGELWGVEGIAGLMVVGMSTWRETRRCSKSVSTFVASMNYDREQNFTKWYSQSECNNNGDRFYSSLYVFMKSNNSISKYEIHVYFGYIKGIFIFYPFRCFG